MNISQPTFHRLVSSARRKISDAIVNAKAIKIEGGNFNIMESNPGRKLSMERKHGVVGSAFCVCPACGYKEPKARGIPCIERKCPKCGNMMMRG